MIEGRHYLLSPAERAVASVLRKVSARLMEVVREAVESAPHAL